MLKQLNAESTLEIMMSNTNTEQWGNIELPGLSDEKLFNTNWEKLAIMREVGQRDSFRRHSTESNLKTWANPQSRNNRVEGMKRAWANEETLAKKTRINKEVAQRPDVKEKNLKNIMSRATPIFDVEKNITHESLTAVARYYDVAVGTVQYWLKTSKKDKFYYV
jgi:hypothetical protein